MLGAMRRRVENLLTERGMTTKWLYEGIGMSKVGYRQMWERDSIKVRSLVSIARRLGVTVSWLMGEGAPDQAADGLRTTFEALAEVYRYKTQGALRHRVAMGARHATDVAERLAGYGG